MATYLSAADYGIVDGAVLELVAHSGAEDPSMPIATSDEHCWAHERSTGASLVSTGVENVAESSGNELPCTRPVEPDRVGVEIQLPDGRRVLLRMSPSTTVAEAVGQALADVGAYTCAGSDWIPVISGSEVKGTVPISSLQPGTLIELIRRLKACLLYTSPSPRDRG